MKQRHRLRDATFAAAADIDCYVSMLAGCARADALDARAQLNCAARVMRQLLAGVQRVSTLVSGLYSQHGKHAIVDTGSRMELPTAVTRGRPRRHTHTQYLCDNWQQHTGARDGHQHLTYRHASESSSAACQQQQLSANNPGRSRVGHIYKDTWLKPTLPTGCGTQHSNADVVTTRLKEECKQRGSTCELLRSTGAFHSVYPTRQQNVANGGQHHS